MANDAADVQALVASIEARVAQRREDGEYPIDLIERLHETFAVADAHQPPEVLCAIESARPLRSNGVVTFAKRVVRRSLAWYVAPIAHDQTQFNLAILRELRRIERRLERIESLRGDGTTPPHGE